MSATPSGLTVANNIFGSNPIGTRGLQVGWNNSTLSVATLSFSAPISAFGAYFIDNSSSVNASISLFNQGDFIRSISATGESGNSAEWWGFVANAGEQVTQVVFSTTSNGDGFGFDNLTFSTPNTSVPAPATLALFGLSIAGLGWSKRKKA